MTPHKQQDTDDNGPSSNPPPDGSQSASSSPPLPPLTHASLTAAVVGPSPLLSHNLAPSQALSGSAIEDEDGTTRIPPDKAPGTISPTPSFPDAISVTSTSSRPDPDLVTNRLSFSSLYSLGSVLYDRARGAVNSDAPLNQPHVLNRKSLRLQFCIIELS